MCLIYLNTFFQVTVKTLVLKIDNFDRKPNLRSAGNSLDFFYSLPCVCRWSAGCSTSASTPLWINPWVWSSPKCWRRSSATSYQNSRPAASSLSSSTRDDCAPRKRTQCLNSPTTSHHLTEPHPSPIPPDTTHLWKSNADWLEILWLEETDDFWERVCNFNVVSLRVWSRESGGIANVCVETKRRRAD